MTSSKWLLRSRSQTGLDFFHWKREVLLNSIYCGKKQILKLQIEFWLGSLITNYYNCLFIEEERSSTNTLLDFITQKLVGNWGQMGRNGPLIKKRQFRVCDDRVCTRTKNNAWEKTYKTKRCQQDGHKMISLLLK